MALKLVSEPQQERRGIDYATLSFASLDRDLFRETFAGILDIFEETAPSLGFDESGADPHYDRVFRNEIACRLAMTEPESEGGRNRGSISLSLPGSFFYLLPQADMADAFFAFPKLRAFKTFTRLDFQNTELEPEVDAYAVLAGIQEGRFWVKGHSRWREYAEKNSSLEMDDGLTIYWGSARSEKMGRTYDKARQKPVWDKPAIRDEVETRGKWASSHGDWLIRDAQDSKTPKDRLTVMEKNATFALRQHLMYYELGSTPPSDKNWLRNAKPADWYSKRIGKAHRPITKTPEKRLDLEQAVSAGVRQYGRIFYRYMWEVTHNTDATQTEALEMLSARWQATLKEEDIDWLCPGGNEQERAEWRAHLSEVKDDVAIGDEHGWIQPNE